MPRFRLHAAMLLLALASSDDRLVVLRGDPLTRGATLARARGSSIRKLFEAKQAVYKKVPGALARWSTLAQESLPYIQRHAPTAWGELEGAAIAGVAQIDRQVMLMLAVEYELYVEVTSKSGGSHLEPPANKCTGFGSPGLAGQNNDEPPAQYLSASEDVVLSIEGDSDGDTALVYTHPGWPAYMGMNSRGLSVLWQYVDTGERSKGLPTNVLIRELIAQKSLDRALNLLECVPRTIPNNFILTDSTQTVNVEVSPSHFSALSILRGFVVHANHLIFDQEMQDMDIGVHVAKTSVQRERAMRAMVKERGSAGITAKDLRSMLLTHPVYRNGTGGTDNETLGSMVFDSRTLRMSIWFKGEAYGATHEYSLDSQVQHVNPPSLSIL